MKHFFSLLPKILDFFLPRSCLKCGINGTFICSKCEKSLYEGSYPSVLNTDFLEKVYIASEYKNDNLVGKLIKRVKYKFSEELASILGDLVAVRIHGKIQFDQIDCLIPVPLSKERMKWRGFNQANLIGKNLIEKLENMGEKVELLENYLKKIKDTPPQAGFKRSERISNLNGAFKVDSSISPPKAVCLFDDVYTTGSTLNECARVLQSAGVKHVFGLVIAKKTV